MKHTLSLFTILLVFIRINTTAQETDWEKEELKGKVKTVKEYRYFILDSIRFDSIFYSDSYSSRTLIMNVISDTSFAILIDTLEPPVIKTYSEEGHLLTKEDVGWSTTKYKYDKNGNLTAATVYDNEKDVYSKNKYKYSKTGDLIKEKHYRKRKPAFERINYQYDRYNNIVSIKSFVLNTNSYGKKIRCRKATESYRYEYDSCGRMLKSYHTGGVLTPSCDEDYPYETIYIYDDKGNLEKTYHYEYNSFCDGIPITKHFTTKLYDDRGNVIEEKGIYYYLAKNTAVHDPVIRYEYDSDGRCTSQLRYGENCISHWITNYDEHGNISQRLSGCGDERKTEDEYKYLYDDNN